MSAKGDPEGYVCTTMARLHINWRALPNRQRVVLVLRYYEQLSDEEIARTLGISRGTVRSQAARGLDKLRATTDARTDTPATRK